ncbi:hypothetical protein ABEX78_23145 [Priestia megaterium]
MNVITLEYVLEELKEERPLWDKDMLDCLVRGHVNDLSQEASAEELINYLNKGNVTVEVKKSYTFSEDDCFMSFSNEEQENEYKDFLKANFGNRSMYGDRIYDYCAWEWLKSMGETEYQPKRSKLSFFAPTLKVSGRKHDCKPAYILERLKKGDHTFITVFRKGESIYLAAFNNSNSFMETVKEQKKKERALKSLYKKGSTKSIESLKDRSFNPADIGTINETVKQYDLVCWIKDQELKKGLVTHIVEAGEDVKQIIDEIPMSFFYVKRKFLGKSKVNKKRCLVKILHSTNEEYYYAPPLSDVSVVMSGSVNKLYELVNVFFKNVNQDIEWELVDDDSANWNAAFIPHVNKVVIDIKRMLNTIIINFINENILPNETITLILSHELGHADKKSLYNYKNFTEEYEESLNESLRYISEMCKVSYWHSEASKMNNEQLKKLKDKIEQVYAQLSEFGEMELRSELEAYEYGKVYIPPHILPYFSKDSWNSFKGYMKTNKERIFRVLYYRSYVECLIRFQIKKNMNRSNYLRWKIEKDKNQEFIDLKKTYSLDNFPNDYLFSCSEVKDIYNAFKEKGKYSKGRMETQKVSYLIQKGKIDGRKRDDYRAGYVANKDGVLKFMQENGIKPFYEESCEEGKA